MNRTVIPKKLRKEMGTDPEYQVCALKGLLPNLIGECHGRVTREHSLYFAGKKIQYRYAIVPCCAKHHGVDSYLDAGTAVKEIRVWVALNRATDEELGSISKAFNYLHERDRLNTKYGVWKSPVYPVDSSGDNGLGFRFSPPKDRVFNRSAHSSVLKIGFTIDL